MDLHLGDSEVSAGGPIVDVDGTWRLTDLESTTGTFVNGREGSELYADSRQPRLVGSTDLDFTTDESRSDDASARPRVVFPDLQDLERFVGHTFQGYDIEGIQAAGNRSVVFRARRQKNGRLTALKILKADFAERAGPPHSYAASTPRRTPGATTSCGCTPPDVRDATAGWQWNSSREKRWPNSLPARGRTADSPPTAMRLGIDMALALSAIRDESTCIGMSPGNIHDTLQDRFKLNGLMSAWTGNRGGCDGRRPGSGRYPFLRTGTAREQRNRGWPAGSAQPQLYTVLTGHTPFS